MRCRTTSAYAYMYSPKPINKVTTPSMPHTLIEQNPTFTKKVEGPQKLAIAEMFCDTIQGEGPHTGVIATFMRLQGCTLKCVWCDTLTVWPNGNEYTFDEIFKMWDDVGLVERLHKGQHLILTGGSPLKQQAQLVEFIKAFTKKYSFLPYIEVENEAVLMPNAEMLNLVSWWNNSPKLANSGMKPRVRIKPDVLRTMSSLSSCFKFVVQQESDWDEIDRDFIQPGLIPEHKIVLMPEGQTQQELAITRPIAAAMAIKHQVRFSDRAHVTIWDRATAV